MHFPPISSCGSMGKLANPFASHAKDPQFEPGWNHFVFGMTKRLNS